MAVGEWVSGGGSARAREERAPRPRGGGGKGCGGVRGRVRGRARRPPPLLPARTRPSSNVTAPSSPGLNDDLIFPGRYMSFSSGTQIQDPPSIVSSLPVFKSRFCEGGKGGGGAG